jgi:hypothetical protein
MYKTIGKQITLRLQLNAKIFKQREANEASKGVKVKADINKEESAIRIREVTDIVRAVHFVQAENSIENKVVK